MVRSVKVHGYAKEWLRQHEIDEDHDFKTGGDDIEYHPKKSKKKKRKNK